MPPSTGLPEASVKRSFKKMKTSVKNENIRPIKRRETRREELRREEKRREEKSRNEEE
jgi:hypothetical protein